MLRYKKLIMTTLAGVIPVIIIVCYIYYKNIRKDMSNKNTTASLSDNVRQKTTDDLPSDNVDSSSVISVNGTSQNTADIATIGSLTVKMPNTLGNNPGNILNGGFISTQGKWIYFNPLFSGFHGLYKSMPDARTGLVKLDEANAWFINVVDSWIYYYDLSNKGIWKIRINGTYKTRILDGEITQLSVKEDWIYYSKKDVNKYTIYKCKTDGSSPALITEGMAFSIDDIGNWIYFSREDALGQPRLYKITTEGSDEVRLGTDYLFHARPFGDWVYALTSGKRNIIRLNTDGSNKSLVCSDTAASFVIHKDWIYYVAVGLNKDGMYTNRCDIYKVRLDGSGKARLNRTDLIRSGSMSLNIVDDWLFGIPQGTSAGSYLYRLKLDGNIEGYVY